MIPSARASSLTALCPSGRTCQPLCNGESILHIQAPQLQRSPQLPGLPSKLAHCQSMGSIGCLGGLLVSLQGLLQLMLQLMVL